MQEILFVINNISYGGASKITVWLAERLITTGYKVSIITNTSNCKRKIPIGVRLIENRQGGNFIVRNTWGIIHSAKIVRDYVKNNNVSLVISYGDHIFYALVLLRIVFKFNLLVAERTDPFSSKGLSDMFRRYLFRFADYFVFQTEEASQYFSKKIRKKSYIINNPVIVNECDLKRIWNIKYAKPIILTVGRLDIRQKRQDVLIKAFSIFAKKHPSYQLWIAGDGVGLPYLKKLVAKENIAESVRFLGYRNDIPDLFLKSKFFVLSSDYEGIPNILIEALQFRIPVISTDCSPGGAKLLLDNGKYGILTSCGDIQELAYEMMQFADSDCLLEDYSKKAADALVRFKEADIFQKWVDCISDISFKENKGYEQNISL